MRSIKLPKELLELQKSWDELIKQSVSHEDLDKYSFPSTIQYNFVSDASSSPTGGKHKEIRVLDDGSTRKLWVRTRQTWVKIDTMITSVPDHIHSASGEGGQLDWDNIWSDAVHTHENDGGGGQISGAGLTAATFGDGIQDSGNAIAVDVSDFAGNGLEDNGTEDIQIKPDVTGGANLAKVINAVANGVSVKIDDSTIGENGSNQLHIKANGINDTHIDWGAGANQVDMDNIANGSTNYVLVRQAAEADLNQTISDPPTQAEVQAISNKMDAVLAKLRGSNVIAT